MNRPIDHKLSAQEAIERVQTKLAEKAQDAPEAFITDELLDRAWLATQEHGRWNRAAPTADEPDAANEWSWIEVPLQSLAADTAKDRYAPRRGVPDPDLGERWSLSRYPIVGRHSVYLMFEAEGTNLERYIGRRIQVLAEGRTYDLGQVKDDGVAELRLDGTVEISNAVVRLGARKQRD